METGLTGGVSADLHGGEPTLSDLIEHIADFSLGAPILMVCLAPARTARPAIRLGLGQSELHHGRAHPPMRADLSQLVARRVRASPLSRWIFHSSMPTAPMER